MKEKVMPYLALKYPLNESTNVNRSLNRIVKEIDNNEVLSNDFFYNSDIVVEYRSNGNYNDLIMRVLNEVISVADAPSTNSTRSKEISNSHEFEEYMTNLFDKVYDPVWVNHKTAEKDEKAILS